MRKSTSIALALAVASVAQSALAQHTVTGTLDTSFYGTTPLATQTVNTGFGDSTSGNGSSGGGSELDAAYGIVSSGTLYLFFAGNFESNGNHVNIFIDDGRAGQNVLNASNASGAMSGMNGSTFGPTFNATYALDSNDSGGTLFTDRYNLITNQANFFGSVPLTGGIGSNQNLSGIAIALNNTNAAGVVGDGGTGTAANTAAAQAVTTGLEVGIPLASLGSPAVGTNIKVMADINGGGDGFLSNQFLFNPGLPVGTTNVGGGGPYQGGSSSKFNLSTLGPGFFTVAVPAANGNWLPTGGGTWGASGNWSNNATPGVAGDTAIFSTATVPSVVTLDGSRTVGSVSFSNANSYTIAQGSGGSLIMDNGANGATIQNFAGIHIISAPVILNSNTAVTVVNSGDSLTISGNISGAGSLTSFNPGGGGGTALVLSGNNNYGGGTIITGGDVKLASATALPVNSNLTFNASDLPSPVLDLNGNSVSVASINMIIADLTHTIAVGAKGMIINTSATPGTSTVTYNGSVGNPSTFYGVITDSSGSGGGTTALTVASGSLTLQGASTYAGATNVNGTSTLKAAATNSFSPNSAHVVAAAGTVDLNGFDQTIGSLAGSGTVLLSANLTTGGNNTGTAFTGPITGIGTLSKVGTGTMDVKNIRIGGLSVAGGGTLHVSASGDAASSASSLTTVPVIDGTSKFDIDDNSVVINYTGSSPLAQVRTLLVTGRGPAGFGNATWNGLGGITSSKASKPSEGLGGIGSGVDPAIGYGENSGMPIATFTAFNGQTVNSSSILIKYTRGADATLDGIVNNDDVTVVGTEFNNPSSGQWYLGDFDYSGTCDNSDVTALGTLFNPTAPPLSPAQLNAEFGSAFAQAFAAGQASAAVPEPTSMVLLGLGGLSLLGRRRRTK